MWVRGVCRGTRRREKGVEANTVKSGAGRVEVEGRGNKGGGGGVGVGVRRARGGGEDLLFLY